MVYLSEYLLETKVRKKVGPCCPVQHHHHQPRSRDYLNSMIEVDKKSRIIFPLLFVATNAVYWGYYLYQLQATQKIKLGPADPDQQLLLHPQQRNLVDVGLQYVGTQKYQIIVHRVQDRKTMMKKYICNFEVPPKLTSKIVHYIYFSLNILTCTEVKGILYESEARCLIF